MCVCVFVLFSSHSVLLSSLFPQTPEGSVYRFWYNIHMRTNYKPNNENEREKKFNNSHIHNNEQHIQNIFVLSFCHLSMHMHTKPFGLLLRKQNSFMKNEWKKKYVRKHFVNESESQQRTTESKKKTPTHAILIELYRLICDIEWYEAFNCCEPRWNQFSH